MEVESKKEKEDPKFKCPECHSPLKQRRSRKVNKCELICCVIKLNLVL